MSAQSETEVKRALFKAAEDALTGKLVKWPNMKFSKPDKATWYEVNFVPVDNEVATLGDVGENEAVGFLQIDVNVPMDSGEKETDEAIKALQIYFVPGRTTVYDGTAAVVTASRRSPGRVVSSSWRTSLTVDYYARIHRQLPTP